MQTELYILLAILLTILGTLLGTFVVAYALIHRYTIGRFRIDINPESPLATFQLEKRPEDFENAKLVFIRVEKADVSLPGTNKSQ